MTIQCLYKEVKRVSKNKLSDIYMEFYQAWSVYTVIVEFMLSCAVTGDKRGQTRMSEKGAQYIKNYSGQISTVAIQAH